MSMIERVYIDRDNPNSLIFKEDDAVIDLSAATRMVLTLVGLNITIDSTGNPNFFDWTTNGAAGEVIFKPAEYTGFTPGETKVRLVVYDLQHPKGQVLIHEDNDDLVVFFDVLAS